MTQDVLKYLQPNAAIPIDMETTSLLVNALKKALAEHAMREVQRLGQEIEQEPVKCNLCDDSGVGSLGVHSMCICQYAKATPPQRTWIGLEGAEFGWFCHTDFLNARKYTKKQRKKICDQLLSEAQSWDGEEYQLMMHDSTKRPFIGLTDEDMCVVSEEESCSFIAGAKWSEAILKDKNT